MELVVIVILSALLPVMSIASFVIGYNINAPKKILKPKPKAAEPTEDEKMLDRIDNARI